MGRKLVKIGHVGPFGYPVGPAHPFFVGNLRPFGKRLDNGLDGRFGPPDIGMLPKSPNGHGARCMQAQDSLAHLFFVLEVVRSHLKALRRDTE